ncbi:hypothetical protein [Streptomyces cavernae]|uniref:hypothetical protein n=1 Tax=Streptomyces cavernae TaxID=2259034 RepID=UPI000FEBAD03|nr:hypothetical protein [Streptomyces cavernae]
MLPVILPRVSGDTKEALLAEAGVLLSAEPFSDELLIIDTSLAAPKEAAHRVREQLRSRPTHFGPDRCSTASSNANCSMRTPRSQLPWPLRLDDLES